MFLPSNHLFRAELATTRTIIIAETHYIYHYYSRYGLNSRRLLHYLVKQGFFLSAGFISRLNSGRRSRTSNKIRASPDKRWGFIWCAFWILAGLTDDLPWKKEPSDTYADHRDMVATLKEELVSKNTQMRSGCQRTTSRIFFNVCPVLSDAWVHRRGTKGIHTNVRPKNDQCQDEQTDSG